MKMHSNTRKIDAIETAAIQWLASPQGNKAVTYALLALAAVAVASCSIGAASLHARSERMAACNCMGM